MLGLISRLFCQSSPRRTVRGCRMRLEALEARDVPALIYYWRDTTGDHQFNNPDNWADLSQGAPVSGEGGEIHFSASEAGFNGPCEGMAGEFGSLYFDFWYSGTVTFSGPVTVGSFYMDTGTINQSSSTPLTVTSDFQWYGGTINGSASLSDVNIDGASALIDPFLTGTVLLGSNLNFTGGATGTINPGTVLFNLGAEFILTNAAVTVNAATPGGQAANVTLQGLNGTWTNNGTGHTLQLSTGSTLTVTGPGNWTNDGMRLVINGGTADIQNNGQGDIRSPTPVGADPTTLFAIIQYAGRLRLHTGSTIKVQGGGFAQAGGTLEIVGDQPGGATIDGRMALSSGDVTFSGNYLIFTVTQLVTWTGGRYRPRVDIGTNDRRDLWLMGSLHIPNNSSPVIAPVCQNYVVGQGVTPGFRWTVIRVNGTYSVAQPPTVQNDANSPPLQRYDGFPPPQPGARDWMLGT